MIDCDRKTVLWIRRGERIGRAAKHMAAYGRELAESLSRAAHGWHDLTLAWWHRTHSAK